MRYQGPLAGTATVPRNGRHVAFAFSVASDDAAEVAAFLATFPHTDQPAEPEPERTPTPTDSETPHFSRNQVSAGATTSAWGSPFRCPGPASTGAARVWTASTRWPRAGHPV